MRLGGLATQQSSLAIPDFACCDHDETAPTMPSFKSLSSKMLGGIKKSRPDAPTTGGSRDEEESGRSGGSDSAVDLPGGDSPEAVASRSVV